VIGLAFAILFFANAAMSGFNAHQRRYGWATFSALTAIYCAIQVAAN
jgi:hypothetical protein